MQWLLYFKMIYIKDDVYKMILCKMTSSYCDKEIVQKGLQILEVATRNDCYTMVSLIYLQEDWRWEKFYWEIAHISSVIFSKSVCILTSLKIACWVEIVDLLIIYLLSLGTSLFSTS